MYGPCSSYVLRTSKPACPPSVFSQAHPPGRMGWDLSVTVSHDLPSPWAKEASPLRAKSQSASGNALDPWVVSVAKSPTAYAWPVAYTVFPAFARSQDSAARHIRGEVLGASDNTHVHPRRKPALLHTKKHTRASWPPAELGWNRIRSVPHAAYL